MKQGRVVAAILLAAAAAGAVAWFLLPKFNARYYWDKAALRTVQSLSEVTGLHLVPETFVSDSGKLIVDQAYVDGRSVLILPGGFGISFERDEEYAAGRVGGALDIYFMGSIRKGIQYWGDDERVQFDIPDLLPGLGEVKQDIIIKTIGLDLRCRNSNTRIKDPLIMKLSHILRDYPMTFKEKENGCVTLCLSVPSEETAKVITQLGALLDVVPGSLSRRWRSSLEDCRNELESKGKEIQMITFQVNSRMQLVSVEVPDLLKAAISDVKPDGKLDVQLWLQLGDDSFWLKAKLLCSVEDEESFIQIPNMEIRYEEPSHLYECRLSGEIRHQGIKDSVDWSFAAKEAVHSYDLEEMKQIRNNFINELTKIGFDYKQ